MRNTNQSPWNEPETDDLKLSRMGLTKEIFSTAAVFGHGYRADCTRSDGAGAAGQLQVIKTRRALNDQLIEKGWYLENINGTEHTWHPDREFSIVCAGGNANTGIESRQPKTTVEKGPNWKQAVCFNAGRTHQMNFGFEGGIRGVAGGAPCWCFLFYTCDRRGEVRSELSLPIGWDKQGLLDTFLPRLLMPSIPFGSQGSDGGQPKETGPVNVPVERRT